MAVVDQIRRKVERAEQHIGELRAGVTAFNGTKPYAVGTKEDPHTRRLVYCITRAEEVPPTIPLIAGDALQNLRSALDHLAWQLVPPCNQNRQTAFPISDDLKKYETEKVGKVKGISTRAMEAIDKLKPYKGGNDVLWRLHRLNNIDKHRLLIAIGAAYKSVNIAPHFVGLMLKAGVAMHMGLGAEAGFQMPDIHLRPEDNLFPLKVGSELFVDMPGADPNPKLTFHIDAAFGETGICEGEPLLETLKEMLGAVQRVIADLIPFLP